MRYLSGVIMLCHLQVVTQKKKRRRSANPLPSASVRGLAEVRVVFSSSEGERIPHEFATSADGFAQGGCQRA